MMDLDRMLTAEKCAQWLGISKPVLLRKSRGRNAQIPAFRLNRRVYRYHPRTIVAKMAADAGVKPEVIAASFCEERKGKA